MTRPTSENKTFPYHMKVNSVGLVKGDPDGADNFPHHKEDMGGNLIFGYENGQGGVMTNIASLFQAEPSTKYQVDGSNSSTESARDNEIK